LVDIYTRVHDPKDKQIIDLGHNVRLIHLKAGRDVEINKLAVYHHLPDFARHLEDFREQNHLWYDLVYSHYWLSGWVGKYLQDWWGVPHIVMFHTLGAVKNTIDVGGKEPELRLRTEMFLVQNSHRIVVATEKEKTDLIWHYGASSEHISVIPCGVNLELFQPMDKDTARQYLGLNGDKSILFVGRIEPLKGIDKLLLAVAYLKDSQKLKLLVVGGDENSRHEIDRLQRLARELQIQDSVEFLGRIRQEELPRFYCAADICVVPSFYESFGLVALESLACGTPVVTTRVGGTESIIRQGETGYLVPDNSPRLLADKIALLISRTNNTAETINLRRESVAGYSWAVVARAIEKECRALLAN
jgi:D-inositol-3-phosphate glycosyltransferase